MIAWVITLPAAAAIGAITWLIGTGLNNLTNTHYVGELVVFLILLAFSIWMLAPFPEGCCGRIERNRRLERQQE